MRKLSAEHSRETAHMNSVAVRADTGCGSPVQTKISLEEDAGHEVLPSSWGPIDNR